MWVGVVFLFAHLPGWATGLLVLALVIAVFIGVTISNWLFPSAFSVAPGLRTVDYEFRSPERVQEFARANGAVKYDHPV